MFGFIEKKHQKRIFFSYLLQFGLTPYNVNPQAMGKILDCVYQQANSVSRRFHEPVASVARNIISAAAWGTIYCLLGPKRMIEILPDYRDIVDEVEMEVMNSHVSDDENTIYRQVFSVLSECSLCHPEVTDLIHACLSNDADEYTGEFNRHPQHRSPMSL
jgi:hypothetical protein